MTHAENPYQSPTAPAAAGRSPPRWPMRLTWAHLFVWLAVALVTAAISVQACVTYNRIAGTDKSPQHIAGIAAAVLLGPMVGPVANPGLAGGWAKKAPWTAALLVGVAASLSPFVFMRRSVRPLAYWCGWGGYVTMTMLWFGSALVSLGIALS